MIPMKRAVFTLGHKGGVGKSLFSGALLDCYRRNGLLCGAFDTDAAIRHLHQYHGDRNNNDPAVQDDPLVGVALVDLRQPRERDGLINILDRDYPLILVDMPAGGSNDLKEGFGLGSPEALVEEYERAGYRITIATVITPIYAASEAVGIALSTFKRSVDHVVVKNLCFGEKDEFPFFDGHEENGQMTNDRNKKAILASGGGVINFPKLRSDTFAMMDRYALSFSQAEEDKEFLTRADRGRVHRWREDSSAAIMECSHLLGFDKKAAA